MIQKIKCTCNNCSKELYMELFEDGFVELKITGGTCPSNVIIKKSELLDKLSNKT